MKISTPEAQGISSKALERFVDKLKEQKIPVHSILMARHGHMIMEAYWKIKSVSIFRNIFRGKCIHGWKK